MKKQFLSNGGGYSAPQVDVTLFVTERGFFDSVQGIEGAENNDSLGWDEE